MSKRIGKISLRGFRGASKAVDIPFDAAKPITMIFGENGTGKSSIIDAIDFICNKGFGSVAERSGTRPKQHIVSVKSPPASLQVSLHYDKSEWTATLANGSPSVSGPTTAPRAHVLRRGKIQQVINAPPSKRYESLQEFIVPPKVEAAESSLRDCVKSLKGSLDRAAQAKVQAEDSLNDSWTAEGRKGKDCLAWAKSRANESEDALKAVAAQAQAIQTCMDKAQTAVDAWADALKVRNEVDGRKTKAQKAVQDAEKESQESDLIELLTAAQKYLPKSVKPEECPLCERSGITVADLLARIKARMEAMKRMVILKRDLDTARGAAEKAATVFEHSRATLVSAVRNLAQKISKAKLSEITDLKLNWDQFPAILSNDKPEVTDAVLKEAQKLQLAAKPAYDSIKTRQEAATRAANQLGMIKRALKAVEENSKKAHELDAQLKRGQAILLIVEKRRKGFVEGILVAISTEVGALCDKLNPGEGIKIRLFLDPKARGSLKSEGEFEGVKNVPPQAYYSESHLDTLGVCIFLALTKKFGGKDAVVILDDVVTSVDSPHMSRFLDLLVDQTEHFGQIIVATHYRPWIERIRQGRGPSAHVQIVHLAPWTLAQGIRHGESKLPLQELRDSIAVLPVNRQRIASDAGVLLESLLDQLSLQYRCRMPRRPEPEYTLGELLKCFGKKLRKGLKCEVLSDDNPPKVVVLQPLLDALSEVAWIRNQVGCHWNMKGFDVPDKDVLALAETTVKLADALICTQCGSLPMTRKEGTHWQCRCAKGQTLRLTPLENPD
ncbi:MAG: AAA family ATPase [Elusimicrobiota bacterium]